MTAEWAQVIIAGILFVCSGIAAVWRVSWVVSTSLAAVRKEFSDTQDLKDAEVNAKIGKVWERFDAYKTVCDGTFVRQQTCTLIHNGTEKALVELSRNTEKNSTESTRRMDNIEKKLDALIVALVEKKG